MAINNIARLAHWYRATTVAGPELQAMTQVFADPDGGTHIKTKLDGAGLSVSENENDNSNKQPYNRSIVIGDNIFWLQANTIYAWNTSTGGQTTSHTLPSGSNGKLRGLNTGIYQMTVSGVPHLVTVHAPDDSTLRAATYNIATAGGWQNRKNFNSSVLGFSAVEASGGFRTETHWHNKLYIVGNRSYVVYNPETDTYINGGLPPDTIGPYDFCPYQGKLYLSCQRLLGGDIRIYEMVDNSGPNLVAATPGYGISNTSDTLEGRSVLFTDRQSLYCIHYSSGTPQTGFGIYKFENVGGSLSFIADVSSTIQVSAAAAKNGADINNTARFRANCFVNQNQNPDGQEGIVFYFDRGGGTGNHITPGVGQYYEQEVWSSNSTNFMYDDATFEGRVDDNRDYSFQMAYTNTKNGAGERVYNISISPEPRIQVTSVLASGGIVYLGYRIHTNTINFPNGTSAAVLFKYDANMHSPRTNCYLQNSSHGTIVGNRKIVVSANNSTDYTVQWNAVQDGFSASSRLRAAIVPFISTTGTS